MRNLNRSVLAVLMSVATAAGAQPAAPNTLDGAPLPASFSGRWDFEGRFSNTWSIKVSRIDADGRVTGTVTYHGVICKAWNDPILNGTWKDGVLRMSVDGGSACRGNMHFTLRRGAQRFFEGNSFAEATPSNMGTNWLEVDQ